MEKNIEPSEKILAIETSGKILSVAIAESSLNSKCCVKGELFFDVGLRHSEILKEACSFLMEKSLWKKEDLNFIAVSTGPGSFTGLRVGIAFARALAQTLHIPLIGVPSFEIMAQGVSHEKNSLCVMIDSIGEEVFAGFFNPGRTKPKGSYKIFHIDHLCKKLKTYSKIICAGNGFGKYKNKIEKYAGIRFISAPSDENIFQARRLAELAQDRIKSGKIPGNSWKKVFPFYLRNPIAVERKEKYRQHQRKTL